MVERKSRPQTTLVDSENCSGKLNSRFQVRVLNGSLKNLCNKGLTLGKNVILVVLLQVEPWLEWYAEALPLL